MDKTSDPARVEEVQGRLKMADGFELFYRRWKSAAPVKRTLVCVHGRVGNSEEFGLIGSDLAAKGTDVYAIDVRGFGNSKEEGLSRGDTRHPGRFLQDLDQVLGFVREDHPDKKLFVMGHSFGADAVLWCAANRPNSVVGIILAAPGIMIGKVFHERHNQDFLRTASGTQYYV